MKRTRIQQAGELTVSTSTGVSMFCKCTKIFVSLNIIAIALAGSLPAYAMLNPSSVYCRALGYEYITAHISKGTLGVCKLSETRIVDASKFYSGLVAVDANYCSLSGYETRHIEDNGVCRNCAVCVMPNGEEVPVAQAMNLNFRESICGDNKCGTGEHFGNCPQDCVSGLYDEFCDAIADQKCDRDCVDQQLDDPDCVPIEPVGIDGGSADRRVQIVDAAVDARAQQGGDVDTSKNKKPAVPRSGCGCQFVYTDTVYSSIPVWIVLLGLALRRQRRGC